MQLLPDAVMLCKLGGTTACWTCRHGGAAAATRPALPVAARATINPNSPFRRCLTASLALPLLPAIQVGGIVFVHAKQQYFLLEDVQEMLVGAAAAGGDRHC